MGFVTSSTKHCKLSFRYVIIQKFHVSFHFISSYKTINITYPNSSTIQCYRGRPKRFCGATLMVAHSLCLVETSQSRYVWLLSELLRRTTVCAVKVPVQHFWTRVWMFVLEVLLAGRAKVHRRKYFISNLLMLEFLMVNRIRIIRFMKLFSICMEIKSIFSKIVRIVL